MSSKASGVLGGRVIDLCEVTISCVDTAQWSCRITNTAHGGRVIRPILACSEHRKMLEAEAAVSRQTVTAEVYPAPIQVTQ